MLSPATRGVALPTATLGTSHRFLAPAAAWKVVQTDATFEMADSRTSDGYNWKNPTFTLW